MNDVVGSTLTRRRALAGIGAGGIGVALSAAGSSAQDSSPEDMAGHPMIGTWIVVRNVLATNEAPSIVAFTADGSVLDPSQGVAGVWAPTGPQSAGWTLVALPGGGSGGYAVIRAVGDVAEDGLSVESHFSFTGVSTDGTVLGSGEADSHFTRLMLEPVEAVGTGISGFPTWVPTPPDEATPTS